MNAKIYRQAAEITVDRGNDSLACLNIRRASKNGKTFNWEKDQHVSRFTKFFKPKNTYTCGTWWQTDLRGNLARSLALLLMERITKDMNKNEKLAREEHGVTTK